MSDTAMITSALVMSALSIPVSGLSMYWSWLARRFHEGRPPRRYWIPRGMKP